MCSLPRAQRTAHSGQRPTRAGIVCSTGIGNGLALQHAILGSATRPVALLATLETPVDFGSPDNTQVDVMALVLGADGDTNGYLSTVNAVSQILHQRHTQLRDASHPCVLPLTPPAVRVRILIG